MGVIETLKYEKNNKLEVILQSEVAECGLACIAMIANFYNYKVDMNTLRKKSSTSLNGVYLHQLVSLASELGFSSRALSIELSDMKHLQLPCILHWNHTHFVVLKSISSKGAVIIDPSVGEVHVSLEKLSNHFTGVAMEIKPSESFEPQNEFKQLKLIQLAGGLRGFKKAFFVLFSMTVLVQLFSTLLPFMVQTILDEVIISSNEHLMPILFFGFGVLLIFSLGAYYLRAKMLIKLSSQVILSFESKLLRHLMKLPVEFFQKRHVGDVISRFSSLNSIREFLTSNIIEALFDSIMVIIVFAILISYSPTVAVVILVGTIFHFCVQWSFLVPLKRQSDEELNAMASQDSLFLESIRSMQSIKLFGKETERENQWLNLYIKYLNSSITLFNTKLTATILLKLISHSLNLTVIFIALGLALEQSITIGMLIAILAYKELFFQSSINMIQHVIDFMLLRVHLDRIADIALSEKEDDDAIEAKGIMKNEGSAVLEVKNISFSYPGSNKYVFQNVSLTVYEGETIALVGPSGEGKSTLIKILASLIELQDGDIYINGNSLRCIGLKNYRTQISAVMQDDTLLSGSIMQNISFFEDGASLDFINKCAEIAELTEDIKKMPMGYHTKIGDMGSTLSGGQKQRLMIARALYQKPELLFLDEATSHLDAAAEARINHNLKKIKSTKIIVAHRLETIKTADRIFHLHANGLLDLTEKYLAHT